MMEKCLLNFDSLKQGGILERKLWVKQVADARKRQFCSQLNWELLKWCQARAALGPQPCRGFLPVTHCYRPQVIHQSRCLSRTH